MLIHTQSVSWVKTHATNATDSSFASKIPKFAAPSGDGVIGLGHPYNSGVISPNGLMLAFFGAGSENDTFDARIIGWSLAGTDASKIWIPTPLAQFTCTLSAGIGVAGGYLTATDRTVDTIITHATIPIGTAGVDWQIASPANDLMASVMIDTKGAQALEIIFDMTGATSANALYKKW